MRGATRRDDGTAAAPVPRIAIVLGKPAADRGRDRGADRVDRPDRVLRLWAMLTAANDEIQATTVPPRAVRHLQQVLDDARAELERALSPALVDEMHRVLPCGGTPAGLAELRIEYVSMVGWLGCLVIEMLAELGAASVRQRQPGRPDREAGVPARPTVERRGSGRYLPAAARRPGGDRDGFHRGGHP